MLQVLSPFLANCSYIRSFIGPVFKNKIESPMVLCINVRTNTRKLFIPQNIPPNSLHVVRNKQFSASDKLSAINGPIDYFKNISVTHRYPSIRVRRVNAIGRKKHESGPVSPIDFINKFGISFKLSSMLA